MLSWVELRWLLGPHGPAGTYEEVVYFLPLAFDHIQQDRGNAIELTSAVVGFVSLFASNLESDGALEAARLNDLLHHWSQDFSVIHETREQRRAAGSTAPYLDYLPNSGLIIDTLENIIEFHRHKDIALDFVLSLAHHNGNPIRAAWFLEFARHQWQGSTPIADQQLIDFPTDPAMPAQAARAVAADPHLLTASPTYWRGVFHLFDLAPESA